MAYAVLEQSSSQHEHPRCRVDREPRRQSQSPIPHAFRGQQQSSCRRHGRLVQDPALSRNGPLNTDETASEGIWPSRPFGRLLAANQPLHTGDVIPDVTSRLEGDRTGLPFGECRPAGVLDGEPVPLLAVTSAFDDLYWELARRLRRPSPPVPPVVGCTGRQADRQDGEAAVTIAVALLRLMRP